MRKNIKGVLKEAMSTQQLVSIHLEPSNMSSCSVGYVDALDNTKIRLQAISLEGENAGYEIRQLDEIYRVDTDTFYLRKIGFLHKNRGKIFSDIDLVHPGDNSDILFSTLREAKDKKVLVIFVILWTCDPDDSIIGYVESITPETVQILSIDDYGRNDGFIVVNLKEIIAADCNARKEQIIGFLHRKIGDRPHF